MEFLFLGSLSASLLTPLSMRLAKALGAIDRPDGERKKHAHPTPRLGGIAVFFTVFIISFFLLPPTALRAAWLSGGALLCVLGVSDDIFSLSPALKLLAEFAIATIPVAFGVVPKAFSLFSFSFSPPAWVANTFTVLWVMVLSNAFNLIDGIDTLAVTQAMLSISLFLSLPAAWLFFGALLGFLPYNKPSLHPSGGCLPTRSFLGDTGALFLGFSLSLFTLNTQETFSLFLPLLFLFPLGECVFSFLRRICKGKNPLSADRGHLHHLIYARTRSVSMTVFALALLTLVGIAAFVLLGSDQMYF